MLAVVAVISVLGAVGGIFTPTLDVGAASGGLFAIATGILSAHALPIPAGAAIGMGAFLAASTHAPLTTILMVIEKTEHYAIVAQGRFEGAISMHDLAALLKDPNVDRTTAWPASLLRADYPRLVLDMPLWDVLRVFEVHP